MKVPLDDSAFPLMLPPLSFNNAFPTHLDVCVLFSSNAETTCFFEEGM